MKQRRTNGISFLLALIVSFSFLPGIGYSRVMVGTLGNQPIRLETELLQNGEYVCASSLVAFFPNRWEYDALSGTLRVIRQDGVRVGVKVGDQRVVRGDRVFPTGKPLIRHQNRVYIPLHIVVEFLLPEAGLRVADSATPVEEKPIITPTPTPFRLSQAPTFTSYYTTPTPTFVLPTFDDLLNTPTPYVPLTQATPPTRAVPRAIIVLDPGIGGNAYSQTHSTGARESDITLGIARKLSALLAESPNFEVFLVQNEANSQPLTPEQRTSLANQSNADLFISFQCGSLFTNAISQAAVFYMNPVLDAGILQALDGKPPGGQSRRWDDAYRGHVSESLRLARAMNRHLRQFFASANIVSIASEPRPGRMAVLRGLTMPSILVELGNLSHRDTVQYLTRSRVQEDLAYDIHQAINDYLYERTGFQYTTASQTE